MTLETDWQLLGERWGMVRPMERWTLGKAFVIAILSGIAIAQGRPWSYLGGALVLWAVTARPAGGKSLIEHAAEGVQSVLKEGVK